MDKPRFVSAPLREETGNQGIGTMLCTRVCVLVAFVRLLHSCACCIRALVAFVVRLCVISWVHDFRDGAIRGDMLPQSSVGKEFYLPTRHCTWKLR